MYKNNEIKYHNVYKKYIDMIENRNDYNEILSTFLIYCNDNGIKWSFPELMGVCPNNDGVFNDELNKFMYAVSDELGTLNNVWRVK